MALKLIQIRRYPVKSLRGVSVDRAAVQAIGLAGDRRWMVVDRNNRFVTIRERPMMTQVSVDLTPQGVVLRREGQHPEPVDTPGASAETIAVRIFRDTAPARDAGPAAAAFLSEALGAELRLVHLADPAARPINPAYARPGETVSFADGFPYLLTCAASLADLNARLAQQVPMERFRPNLVVADDSGATPPWDEDHWAEIQVGAARFRVAKPCDRCVVVTRDHDTGAQPDPDEPLRTMRTFRRDDRGGVLFGQNLIPAAQDGAAPEIAVGDPVEILARRGG